MNLSQLLKDLKASQRGDYYILICPKCGKKEAFLYISDIKKYKEDASHKIAIRCNRLNKCGKVTYVQDLNLTDSEIRINKMPPEKSSVQITDEGIKLIKTFVHYSVDTLKCNYKNFDFDIRGISNSTLKKNGIFYYSKCFENLVNSQNKCFSKKYMAKNYKNRDIFIPIYDEKKELVRILLRSTKETPIKEIGLMLKQGSNEIWNLQDLLNPEKKQIVITEGVYDALSFKEIDDELGVISIPGVRKYRQILKYLDEYEECRNKEYIIATDNDVAGEEVKEKLKKEIKKRNLKCKCFDLSKYKDANEYLQKNRLAFSLKVKKI